MPEIGNLFANRSGNPTHELYNIAEDPHEDNNIAAQYPEKVEELKAIMDREHEPSSLFNFGIDADI